MSARTDNNRALIAAFERARDNGPSRNVSQLFSMALMGVIFLALMGSLAAGASLYRFATTAQLAATNQHLQSGLLANVIHAGDLAGAVAEGTGPEGPALVLRRRLASGTYETRIYRYEGSVVQELSAAGRPYDPLGATPLIESDTFSFTREGQLLTITTDEGSFVVALRSIAGTPDDLAQDEAPPALESILDEGGM